MEIKYSETASKQLKKIAKGDKKSASLILKTIESYRKNPRGRFDVKVLKGDYGDFKRLRAGNYRILFDEQYNVMFIYEIKHRQEAYHD
jgi:mRNA-degrading endonuclease RelE of RelBE toxin-antitoxin system